MYEIAAYKLLCVSSIRRLFDKLHCERHGNDARKEISKWVKDLRKLKNSEKMESVKID